LDVHQTLPLPHKTLRYFSSWFIYVTDIHFMDFGMMSLEFGPHSLKAWSWKPKRPWTCKSFTNYKLHFVLKMFCDILIVSTWKLVAYCLILSNFLFFQILKFIVPPFKVECGTGVNLLILNHIMYAHWFPLVEH
jgi:hypothetical protein